MAKHTPILFILHWNCPEACLRSIEAFSKTQMPIVIKVIDNGSNAAALQVLEGKLPRGVIIIRFGQNLGWGCAFNRVFREWLTTESCEFCFISAHDTLPEPYCIDKLVHALQRNRRLGIVSPQYGTPDLPVFSPVRGPRLIPVKTRSESYIERSHFVHGTLMGFRKSCLKTIGLFDERFFAYGDEIEISLRANRHGWDTAIVWGAILKNPGTSVPAAISIHLQVRNTLLMARIYGGIFSALLRAALIIANTGYLVVTNQVPDKNVWVPARLLAVWDFMRGRFGRPVLLGS
jgi:N-acetylglucosaminyl-diphospho-decaprenol L-rhamnosyltransferase